MKRMLCLLLALVLLLSLCVQAFADDDVLYCRMCGKRIPADSKVCSYCGVKVVLVEDDTNAAGKTTDSSTKESSNPTETASAAAVKTTPASGQTTAPAVAADSKTALAQSTAPSPATVTSPAPGPFNTTLGTNTAPRAKVYVTKSPTSESVPYGGSCMFIAHAANATSITWYIASSDGSLICAASDAPYSVSGLYVSGANSDTLYLSGIPSWWNGCQVQACFTGEGGPVYTDIARIWTYQPTPEVKSSGWSIWDWFNYWYWDDPDLPDYPWWYWYDLWDDTPNPPDVKHSVTLPNGASVAPEKPGPGIIYKGEEATVVGHTHTPGGNTNPSGNNSSGNVPPPPPPGPNPGSSNGGSGSGSSGGGVPNSSGTAGKP